MLTTEFLVYMLSQFAMCYAQFLEMKTAIGMLKTGIAIIYTIHKGLPKGHDNLMIYLKVVLLCYLMNSRFAENHYITQRP